MAVLLRLAILCFCVAVIQAAATKGVADDPQPDPKPEPGPETPAPETPAPETPAPETQAPETPAPETQAPETPAPETPAPETPAPQTQAPPPCTEGERLGDTTDCHMFTECQKGAWASDRCSWFRKFDSVTKKCVMWGATCTTN